MNTYQMGWINLEDSALLEYRNQDFYTIEEAMELIVYFKRIDESNGSKCRYCIKEIKHQIVWSEINTLPIQNQLSEKRIITI